jgi:hypothetical protein
VLISVNDAVSAVEWIRQIQEYKPNAKCSEPTSVREYCAKSPQKNQMLVENPMAEQFIDEEIITLERSVKSNGPITAYP